MLFAEFRADPENNPLRTPSGRTELYSDEIAGFAYDDCPLHPAWIEPAEWLGGGQASAFPLHLVSNQPRRRLHSQMDAGPVSARGKIAGREALAINPADAQSRGIGPAEASVDRPGVAPVRSGKGRPQPVRVRWRHDQVGVMGHQTISPHCCAGAPRHRRNQPPIEAIVVGLATHGLAPITALSDMVRQARHNTARSGPCVCFMQPIARW